MYNLANVALRLTTNLNLAGDNVEETYRTILARIAKANGRVQSSSMNRHDATQAHTRRYSSRSRPPTPMRYSTTSARGTGAANERHRKPRHGQRDDGEAGVHGSDHPRRRGAAARSANALGADIRRQRVMQNLTSSASGAGGRTIESNLSQDQCGKQVARLVVEVPLSKADQLIDEGPKDGKVRMAKSSKNTQVPEGPLAAARLNLTIGSGEAIVPESTGSGIRSESG